MWRGGELEAAVSALADRRKVHTCGRLRAKMRPFTSHRPPALSQALPATVLVNTRNYASHAAKPRTCTSDLRFRALYSRRGASSPTLSCAIAFSAPTNAPLT